MAKPVSTQCDVYTCSDTTHEVPDASCWVKTTDKSADHYYVKSCTDSTKPVCPLPPSIATQGVCEALVPVVQHSYPGEICNNNYVCYND